MTDNTFMCNLDKGDLLREVTVKIRNMDSLLNKEGPIEHTVEVNIYYQGHRERTEVDGNLRNVMVSSP